MKDYKLQSILFNKKKYNRKDAIKWLVDHHFKYIKTDETKNYYRMRQLEPSRLKMMGYNIYRNHRLNDDIIFVLAYNNYANKN
jgi:hypothetical protein